MSKEITMNQVDFIIEEFLEFISPNKKTEGSSPIINVHAYFSRPEIIKLVENMMKNNEELLNFAKESLGIKIKHRVISHLAILAWYEYLKLKEIYSESFDFNINLQELLEIERYKNR